MEGIDTALMNHYRTDPMSRTNSVASAPDLEIVMIAVGGWPMFFIVATKTIAAGTPCAVAYLPSTALDFTP